MSSDADTDLLDRMAVAYVQGHAVNAKFIWREFTGRDIGVDAVLEPAPTWRHSKQPPSDARPDELRGLVLVQIKATGDPQNVNVRLKSRHFDYWLTQQLPVVVCRVFPNHNCAYWVDFKSWAKSKRPPITTKSWTLDIREHLGEDYVRKTLTQTTDLNDWLQSVLTREAEEIVESALCAAEGLLGGGHPEEAKRLIEDVPRWALAQIKASRRKDLLQRRAKTWRRLGETRPLERMLKEAKDPPMKELIAHELALAYWTRAYPPISRSGQPAGAAVKVKREDTNPNAASERQDSQSMFKKAVVALSHYCPVKVPTTFRSRLALLCHVP